MVNADKMTSDDLVQIISRNTWPEGRSVPIDPVFISKYETVLDKEDSEKELSEDEKEKRERVADSRAQFARLNVLSRQAMTKQFATKNYSDPRNPEKQFSLTERNSQEDAHFLILVQFLALYQEIHRSNQNNASILTPFNSYEGEKTAAQMAQYRTILLEFLNRVPAAPAKAGTANVQQNLAKAQNRLDRAMACLNALIENPEGPIQYTGDDGKEKTLSDGACLIFQSANMNSVPPVHGLVVGKIKLPEVPISKVKHDEWLAKFNELAEGSKDLAETAINGAQISDRLSQEIDNLLKINPKLDKEKKIIDEQLGIIHRLCDGEDDAKGPVSLQAFAYRIQNYADEAALVPINGETNDKLDKKFKLAWNAFDTMKVINANIAKAEELAKAAMNRAKDSIAAMIAEAQVKANKAKTEAELAVKAANNAVALDKEAEILGRFAPNAAADAKIVKEQVEAANEHAEENEDSAQQQAQTGIDAVTDLKGIAKDSYPSNVERIQEGLKSVKQASEGVAKEKAEVNSAISKADAALKRARKLAAEKVKFFDKTFKEALAAKNQALELAKRAAPHEKEANDLLKMHADNQDARDALAHLQGVKKESKLANDLFTNGLSKDFLLLNQVNFNSTKAAADAERIGNKVNDESDQILAHNDAAVKANKEAIEALKKARAVVKQKLAAEDKAELNADNEDEHEEESIAEMAKRLADAAEADAEAAEALREEAESYSVIPGANIVIPHINAAHDHAHEWYLIEDVLRTTPNCATNQAILATDLAEQSKALSTDEGDLTTADLQQTAKLLAKAREALKRTELERNETAKALNAAKAAMVKARAIASPEHIAQLAKLAADEAQKEAIRTEALNKQLAALNPSEADTEQASKYVDEANAQANNAQEQYDETITYKDAGNKEDALDSYRKVLEARDAVIAERKAMEKLRDALAKKAAARAAAKKPAPMPAVLGAGAVFASPLVFSPAMAKPASIPMAPSSAAADPKSDGDLLSRIKAARQRRHITSKT